MKNTASLLLSVAPAAAAATTTAATIIEPRNVFTDRPTLDCGHAPVKHSYWYGNAHRGADGSLICFRCDWERREEAKKHVLMDCGHPETPKGYDDCLSPGYGKFLLSNGTEVKHCLDCSALWDALNLTENGAGCLYLTQHTGAQTTDLRDTPIKAGDWKLSNWPGTFVIKANDVKRRGAHRIDCTFCWNGRIFAGAVREKDSEICEVDRIPHSACFVFGHDTELIARARQNPLIVAAVADAGKKWETSKGDASDSESPAKGGRRR